MIKNIVLLNNDEFDNMLDFNDCVNVNIVRGSYISQEYKKEIRNKFNDNFNHVISIFQKYKDSYFVARINGFNEIEIYPLNYHRALEDDLYLYLD